MTRTVADVIEITTRLHEAPPVDVRQRRWDECGHRHVEIDAVLRAVTCRDCGEGRLDPLEVLIGMAGDWQRWTREAKRLEELRTDYRRREIEEWERQRDRHLGANPTHSLDLARNGWTRSEGCHICQRLEQRAPRQRVDLVP